MTYVLKGELFFIEETWLSGMLPRPIEDQNGICANGRAVLHRGNTAIRQATNHKAIPRPIEEQDGIGADGRAVLLRGNTAIRLATNHKAIPRPIEE
jgi:hypothetical protein